MIPWLGPEDQHFVLPEGRRYETKEEQESYIRDWLRGAGMTSEADDLGIAWYDARYHQVRCGAVRSGPVRSGRCAGALPLALLRCPLCCCERSGRVHVFSVCSLS